MGVGHGMVNCRRATDVPCTESATAMAARPDPSPAVRVVNTHMGQAGHRGVPTNVPCCRNRLNRKQIWTMRLVILWTTLMSSSTCAASSTPPMEPPRREERGKFVITTSST